MNSLNQTLHAPTRLSIAWKLLVFAYSGLAIASWGILSDGADLSTADGRHLLAGALANFSLVVMGIFVTVCAYRKCERWAWVATTVLIVYAIPMLWLDSHYASFWSMAVIPQLIGDTTALTGLLLPADLFWKRTQS